MSTESCQDSWLDSFTHKKVFFAHLLCVTVLSMGAIKDIPYPLGVYVNCKDRKICYDRKSMKKK